MNRWMDCSITVLLALVVGSAGFAAEEKPSQPAGTDIVKGRVQSAEGSTLKLRAIDGRQLVFQTADDTKLTFNSRDVTSVSQLRKSDRVLVAFRRKGTDHVAVKIMESQVTPEEVVREFQEAFQVTATYAYEQKKEYAEIVSGLLAEMDDLMNDMARQAETEGAEAQQAYTRARKQLMERVDDTQQKLSQAAKSGSQSWKELKAEVDESINELQRAYQAARQDFDREQKQPSTQSKADDEPQE